MRVIIAPDSFKGSVSAADAALAIAAGWRSERPDDDLLLLPQADGGEGTLDAVQAATPTAVPHSVPGVTGPDRRPVTGLWLELPDGTAVLEMAQVSGLPMMRQLDSLGATSRGLGELMAAALDHGVRRMLIGVGGSASTDAGIPVLEALAARVPPVDGAFVLTDVTAPLLGAEGAAAVFGPQKGAGPEQVSILEERLRAVAERLGGAPMQPGAGAGGGVGFALSRWGAQLSSGADFIAETTGLTAQLPTADLVITGEGRFDYQSLTGKVVGSVLSRAHAHGVTPAIIAGLVEIVPECWSCALTDLAGSRDAAIAQPEIWITEAGRRAARALSR